MEQSWIEKEKVVIAGNGKNVCLWFEGEGCGYMG